MSRREPCLGGYLPQRDTEDHQHCAWRLDTHHWNTERANGLGVACSIELGRILDQTQRSRSNTEERGPERHALVGRRGLAELSIVIQNDSERGKQRNEAAWPISMCYEKGNSDLQVCSDHTCQYNTQFPLACRLFVFSFASEQACLAITVWRVSRVRFGLDSDVFLVWREVNQVEDKARGVSDVSQVKVMAD